MWSYNTHHFHIHCLASIFICLERLHVCHIKFYISDKNRNWNFKLNFPFAPRKGIGCNPLSRITGAVAFQKISYPFISQIFSSSPFLIESSHLERQTANVLIVEMIVSIFNEHYLDLQKVCVRGLFPCTYNNNQAATFLERLLDLACLWDKCSFCAI